MKKIFQFTILLLIGVLCSACVNSFAVQKLNNIAKAYIDEGDTKSAIARLEASVDLDADVYQSRYNLALMYLRVDECEKALENMSHAQQLLKKPESSIFYSTAVIYNCLADQVFLKKDKCGDYESIHFASKEKELEAANKHIELLAKAIENYNEYVKMEPNADDTQSVMNQIERNTAKIKSTKEKYSL